ncbi:MAG: 4Fe-4S ferredoxin [bacterium]|nr:MAG: 4Fe-4S ferredoxin [bacterium]
MSLTAETTDYIVVGSGCTGAIAAQTLVEAGAKVLMLDVGKQDNKYKPLIPDKDFLTIRETDQQQYRYLLGENFEAIPWGNIKTGTHLTPPRQFMLDLVDRYLQVDSENFSPLESLAYGGLGNGWGVGCYVFSKPELEKIGLDKIKMMSAYKTVSARIGISGAKDDASPYTIGELDNYQAEFEIDANAKSIYKRYLKKKQTLNKKDFFLGKPALAILTKDLGERKKIAYNDMEFYSDRDQSAYRPWITVEELKKHPNFTYISDSLVTEFTENSDRVRVKAINTNTNEKVSYTSKKLLLASGVLGTARIVLRSFQSEDKQLPLLCNPYGYIPCLQPTMLGREIERHKMGFAQLSLFHDPNQQNFDIAMASIYSYRSLMLFRLIKESPLNFVDGRIFMKYFLSGIVVMGIHHPETSSNGKYLHLNRSETAITGDKLKINYQLSDLEKQTITQKENDYIWAMQTLGCYALKRVNPGYGSSIHYAGTLPFNEQNTAYTLAPTGRLNGTHSVYVADGSGFKYLPAKGLTFSLMANAHLVAESALTE